MKYYLGIDSGGTKTEFALADENGHIVGHARMGTTHYKQCGAEGLRENLSVGVGEVLKASGAALKDMGHAFIGLAAFGEISADMDEVNAAVKAGLKGLKYAIAGDNVCAWAGSLGGKSGVNIVAGTGSIAYAKNDAGKWGRAGGWGHWFGGDEGSAYWIGCQLMLAFSRQSDGREKKTLLYQTIKDHYWLTDDFDFINLVVNKWEMDRSKVAILSKFAYELACQGDPVAVGIFSEAGKQLAKIVDGCLSQVPFEGEIAASYSGGVFNSGELILAPLRESLVSKVAWQRPEFPPSIGGIILAMMAARKPVTPEVRKNLAMNGIC